MNESSKLGTCGCPKSLAEATPCEEKTRWCRVAPVDLRSSTPPRLYLALTAALRSVCQGAQHNPSASAQTQTNRSTQHRSESGSSCATYLRSGRGTPTQHGPAPAVSTQLTSLMSLRGRGRRREPQFQRTEPNYGKPGSSVAELLDTDYEARRMATAPVLMTGA